MSSNNIADYLVPQENPGDVTFVGNRQQSLSVDQERELGKLVRRVRNNYNVSQAKEFLKLFDTENPDALLFQGAILNDIQNHPERYKQDILKAAETGQKTWGKTLLDYGLSLGKWAGGTALTYGIGVGLKKLFGWGYKHKNKRSKNKIKKHK